MPIEIIATVGMCGAGKSVAGEYLRQLGFVRVYFGGLTLEEIKKRNLPLNEQNEKAIREELRAKYGMGAFAILSMPMIEEYLAQGKKILIDGLYSYSEYKILKAKFKERLLVLAVFTPRQLRYQRLAERKIRPLTPGEAQARDLAEIENLEKGGPIALADYTILNDSSLDKLIEQLKKILYQENILAKESI